MTSNTTSMDFLETAAAAKTGSRPYAALYRLGGAAALVVVLAGLLDMAMMFFPGTSYTPGAWGAEEWFHQFQAHPWISLRNLGVLNMVNTTCTVVLYFALTVVHRRANLVYTALALVFIIMGASIYLANNTALPLFNLSSQYAATQNDSQRALLVAAGQVLLAQEDISAGSVIGFILPEIAALLMAWALLRGRIFSTWSAWVGLLGAAALFIFNICAAFLPTLFDALMPLAGVGGLLSMTWFAALALRLFQLARAEGEA